MATTKPKSKTPTPDPVLLNLDVDGYPTLEAIGGLCPLDADPDEFFAKSPAYHWQFRRGRGGYKLKTMAMMENDFRLGLVTKIPVFIRALYDTNHMISKSCEMSGINRMTYEALRRQCPDFNEICTQIYDGVSDKLEAAAYKRAVVGVEKGIYYQGDHVATETVYSDTLLSLMLQGRKSEIYKQRTTTELTGDPSKPMYHNSTSVNMSKEELVAELEKRGLPTSIFGA